VNFGRWANSPEACQINRSPRPRNRGLSVFRLGLAPAQTRAKGMYPFGNPSPFFNLQRGITRLTALLDRRRVAAR